MKIDNIKKQTIELEGDEVANFKSAITSINKRLKEPGFKTSLMSEVEVELLQKLETELKK